MNLCGEEGAVLFQDSEDVTLDLPPDPAVSMFGSLKGAEVEDVFVLATLVFPPQGLAVELGKGVGIGLRSSDGVGVGTPGDLPPAVHDVQVLLPVVDLDFPAELGALRELVDDLLEVAGLLLGDRQGPGSVHRRRDAVVIDLFPEDLA